MKKILFSEQEKSHYISFVNFDIYLKVLRYMLNLVNNQKSSSQILNNLAKF